MVEALDKVAERIRESLGEIVREFSVAKGFIEVLVSPDDLVRAAEILKREGFDHVKSVTAVDYPDRGVIRVTYHTSSYERRDLSKVIVGLSVEVDRANARVKSLVGVWPSVEFQEREVYEFFGVVFEDHPDLRPLLLIDELASKRPLRKEFVVREEPIIRG